MTNNIKPFITRAALTLALAMLTAMAWAGNIADCELRGKMEGFEDGYGPYNSLTANVQVWYGETQLEYNTDYDIEVDYVESYEVGQTYNATIVGMGDWEGTTKGFTFTFVIPHHNVIFVANGGTGTMADGIVGNDNPIYYLPECGFAAPEYKVFDHWEASCEEGVEKQPGDYFTAPYIYQPSDIQTITVTAYWRDALILLDDDSAQPDGSKNAEIIYANDETTGLTVQLKGRTLYKDGKWNTLVLPFDVDMTDPNGPLYGATYRTVTDASIEDTTLKLTFGKTQNGDPDMENTLIAGTPYIIKWDKADDYVDDDAHNIVNPVFNNVNLEYVGGDYWNDDNSVAFIGTYDALPDITTRTITGYDVLLMGGDNKLRYAGSGASLGACRAYFLVDPTKVGNGSQAGARLTTFNMDFGNGEGATGIISLSATLSQGEGAWYSIDGRKLNGKPTVPGIYVNNGNKIIIK